jgi:Arc/MetJ family transcription regulator
MKTVIDLDDEALVLAAQQLGTTTRTETVNAALAFVAGRAQRIEALLDDPHSQASGPYRRAQSTPTIVDSYQQ